MEELEEDETVGWISAGARMPQSQRSRLRSYSAEPPSPPPPHINKTVVLLRGQVEEARLAGSLVLDSVNSGQDGGKVSPFSLSCCVL